MNDKRLTVILYGCDRNTWSGGPLQLRVADVFAAGGPRPLYEGRSEAATIDLLQEVNRRRRVTILIVTHLLPIVLNLADAIMLMGPHGILHGAVDDILHEDRLSALYGVRVRLGRVGGQRTLVVEKGMGLDA